MSEKYSREHHRMQSAVAVELEKCGEHSAGATPKFLRVGLNACFADAQGLARLLIQKGVFTEQEYVEAVEQAQKEEADRACNRSIAKCGLPPGTTFS